MDVSADLGSFLDPFCKPPCTDQLKQKLNKIIILNFNCRIIKIESKW